jgi:hypothetical protein
MARTSIEVLEKLTMRCNESTWDIRYPRVRVFRSELEALIADVRELHNLQAPKTAGDKA